MRKFTLFVVLIALVFPAFAASAQSDETICDQMLDEKPPAISSAKTPAESLYISGREQAERGDFNTAITLFTQSLNLDDELTDAYLFRGCSYLKLEDTDGAAADFDQFIDMSDDDDLVQGVGELLDGLGGDEFCVFGTTYTYQSEAQAVVDSFSSNLTANDLNERGLAYSCLGESDAAIRDFSKALDLDKRNAVYYSNRGLVYIDLGLYDDALDDFNTSLSIEPENPITLKNRGTAYWLRAQEGDLDACVEDYTTLLEIEPDNAIAFNNRGLCYDDLGENDTALNDYTRAIGLTPDDPVMLGNRAWVWLEISEYENALDDFNAAIDLEPNSAYYWNGRGLVYDYMGDFEQALEDYSQAIELDPSYAVAYYNRGYMHRELGNHDEAVEDFETYLEIRPNAPQREEVEDLIAELS